MADDLIDQALSGANIEIQGFNRPKTDPLDKTAASSRYVRIGSTDAQGRATGTGRVVKRNPLGVDTGYTATYRGQRVSDIEMQESALETPAYMTQGIEARYDQTDLDRFAGLSMESVWSIQQALAHAGLLTKAPKGIFDENTRSAMAKVLAYANRRGLLWDDALSEYSDMGMEDLTGDSGPKGPVFHAVLSNPDTLKQTFKQAVYNATGLNALDDDAYQRMVDSYHEQEIAAQRAQFNTMIGGGTSVEQPTAQAFAATDVEQNLATDVKAKRVDDYANVLLQAIGYGGAQ